MLCIFIFHFNTITSIMAAALRCRNCGRVPLGLHRCSPFNSGALRWWHVAGHGVVVVCVLLWLLGRFGTAAGGDALETALVWQTCSHVRSSAPADAVPKLAHAFKRDVLLTTNTNRSLFCTFYNIKWICISTP
jgi:hypothetical protein